MWNKVIIPVQISISVAESEGQLTNYAIPSHLLCGVRGMDEDRHEKRLSLEEEKKRSYFFMVGPHAFPENSHKSHYLFSRF